MEDKTITCMDCGNPFTFSSNEQQFYNERGYQEPKRCKECRDARKKTNKGGGKFNDSNDGGNRGHKKW